MAKLKCKNHDRRCMVLESEVVRHRSGIAYCDSTEVVFDSRTMPAKRVLQMGAVAASMVVEEEPKRKSRAKRSTKS